MNSRDWKWHRKMTVHVTEGVEPDLYIGTRSKTMVCTISLGVVSPALQNNIQPTCDSLIERPGLEKARSIRL